jgi:hypothetical protein
MRLTTSQIFSILLFLGLSTLLLGGCAESHQENVFPTVTPTNSSPPPTATTTSTPTQTAIPTLSTESAYILLQDLLQNNNGCELPCFWGITPRVSTLQDAQKIIAPLRGIAYRDTISIVEAGIIEFDYLQADDIHLFLDVRFVPHTGDTTIETIHIRASALQKVENGYIEVYKSTAFAENLSRYTLTTILQTYGIPAQLSIYVENNPFEWSSPDFFTVFLLYPESGLFFQYTSSAAIGDDKAYSRPTESFIQIWLI